MKDRVGMGALGLGTVLLVLGAMTSARAQGPEAAVDAGSGQQIVREIVDPHTGRNWILLRGNGNPGGPGRMVPAANAQDLNAARSGEGPSASSPGLIAIHPVIRAGDRLIVEEHTRRVEARLEAVALGPAAAGSELSARLKIGGKVVRAVALGPGRATLPAESGVQP